MKHFKVLLRHHHLQRGNMKERQIFLLVTLYNLLLHHCGLGLGELHLEMV